VPITTPRGGINRITLHLGDAGARHTLIQKQQGTPRDGLALIIHWGRFKVFDSWN